MKPRRSSPRFHAVLLAGGSGTRFWPLSRKRRPKQFLALAGARPLLVETWGRARRLAPVDRVWVVAPATLASAVRRMLPELAPGRLIVEPAPRDTAPAAALASLVVERADPGAIVGIFPTDHVVRDAPKFVRAVRAGIAEARRGRLVCLGIEPDRPSTGFGYLACGKVPRGLRPVPVERFVEKPDLRRATRFVRSGRYLWNAGMFIWSAQRFLDEARTHAPELAAAVQEYVAGRRRAWGRVPRISVDYAVMERAKGVSVVPLRAGWDDVGSWDAAARLREELGAADPSGAAILIDSPGTVAFPDGRLVAVVDVPGVVVVAAGDALLVVSRRASERVKQVVDELLRRGRGDLL
jgi:mannose-1-phosphate guanylyltransferase